MKTTIEQTEHTFLFVNKDQQSKSLSKSDGAAAKEINRHAQQVRNRRLEAQKISSARLSSSAARRIALGGWKRKEVNSPTSDTKSSPTPPLTPVSRNLPPIVDQHSLSRKQLTQYPLTPSPNCLPADFLTLLSGQISVDEPEDDFPQNNEDMLQWAKMLLLPMYRANFSGMDCVDPFGQIPIKITSQLHALLQQTVGVYMYAGVNYKVAYLPQHLRHNVSQFPMATVIQRSMFKEHHFYSLMAAITARMKSLFLNMDGCGKPEQFHAAAAHYLRKELIQSSKTGLVDKQIILDLLFLAVNEMQSGRFDACRKHLEVAGKLYHLLDQKQHLEHWISETAAHVDNALALSTGDRPVMPLSFDPGPILPERMAILKREVKSMQDRGVNASMRVPSPRGIAVRRAPAVVTDALSDLASTMDLRMGSRFESGLKFGLFDVTMGNIVHDLLDCIATAKVVWLSPLAVCFDAEWLCRKARALLRALLLLAPDQSGPLSIIGSYMEMFRLSMLIMMSHACTMLGHHVARSYSEKLKECTDVALKYWCHTIGWDDDCKSEQKLTFGTRVEAQAGIVLWSVMIGIFAAPQSPVEPWFTVRACHICRALGLSTFEDIRNHLQMYIYSNALQDESVRGVSRQLEMMEKQIVVS